MAEVDAGYAIEIAASMPEGEATIAELDALTAGMIGAGRDAEFFQDAIKQVSSSLAEARTASTAAAEALGDGNQQYKLLERAANKAAKAAERAARKGEIPPEVQASVVAATAALDKHGAELLQLEQAASAAAAKESELGRVLDNVRKLSSNANRVIGLQAEQLSKVRGAVGALGGPLGTLGGTAGGVAQGFAELSGVMGASKAAALLGVVGVVALTAAVVALTAAAVAGVLALAKWGVGLADAARSADLAREAAEAADTSLVGMRDTISGLADETGQTEAGLRELTRTLREAKVSADDMPAALRAAALAETALGQGGSADFVENIKAGKVAVADLAAETEAAFGGIVAKQMRSLDAQSARLSRNISGLFGGLDIEPALQGMSTLVGLFEEGTIAGDTMKFLFETIFQPIVDQAANAAFAVEAFVLGLLIGMTKIFIAVKPAIKAVTEFFGFEDTALEDTMASITDVGEFLAPVLVGLVAAFAAVAAVVGVVVAAIVAVPVAMLGIPVIIQHVVSAGLDFLMAGFNRVVEFLTGIDLGEVGRNMMQGLAAGITSAGSAIWTAISAPISNAISGVKSMLGIASPSRVFAEIGGFTGEGFAVGVDDAAPAAQEALAAMVEPPDVPPIEAPLSQQDALSGSLGGSGGASAARVPGGAGAGASSPISGNTFVFNGVKDAEDAESRFSEVITRLLEGDALTVGAGAT